MLLMGLVVYVFVLCFPPSVKITKPFSEFHLGMTILLVIFFGLIFIRRGLFWDTISLTLALILFAIPLIYKWQAAEYTGQILGGHLPLSDAQNYYADAQLLLGGSHVSIVSTRRPFFVGFLAVILLITGNNLQISQGVIVALTAISIYLVMREVQIATDSFGAAVYLIICYWFYYPFAGGLMTESLGLSLGSLALAVLLKATRGDPKPGYFVFGLFTLTIALNARQGPFFVLATLAIWIGLLYYKSRRTKYVLLILTLGVASGMLINMALSKIIGSPRTTPFSIYSHFLYSLVTGGQGWPKAAIDHPGVTEEEIFRLSIDIFVKEPSLLFKGIAKSYYDYFAPVDGAFSFMRLVHDQRNTADRLLWGLFVPGLIAAIINRTQKKYGLVLAGIAGIFLSVAFLPPADSDKMRIYAAALPFSFYLVSIGTAVPVSYAGKFLGVSKIEDATWASADIIQPLTIGILLTCLFSPLILLVVGHMPNSKASVVCPADEEEIYFHIGDKASITLIQDNEAAESFIPNIRITDFMNGITSGSIYTFYPFLDRELLGLNAHQTISIVTYLSPQGGAFSGYLITKGGILPPGFHVGCGSGPKNIRIEVPWIYHESSIENLVKVSVLQHNPIWIGLARYLYGLALIFIVVIAVIDHSVFHQLSLKRRLLLFGNIALIIFGILVYLHSNALFPLAWQRSHLKMENAVLLNRYAYQVPLGINWMSQKSIRQPPVNVYEEGIPLERPNAKIYAVKNLGRGRFFVQSGYLYISTSDNSDPRINGRSYEMVWPTPVRMRYQLAIYILSLIGILVYIKFFTNLFKTGR